MNNTSRRRFISDPTPEGRGPLHWPVRVRLPDCDWVIQTKHYTSMNKTLVTTHPQQWRLSKEDISDLTFRMWI